VMRRYDGGRGNALHRRFRRAAIGVVWSTALAVAWGIMGLPGVALAQFQLPPPKQEGEAAPPFELPKVLKYQYAFGTTSDIRYRANSDVDTRVRDTSLIFSPQLDGILTYRPTTWLESTLEMVLEREWAVQEEDPVHLPSGELQFSENRRLILALEQAFVTFKPFGPVGPFELTVGRRNFEDGRQWLYDTALDVALVRFRQSNFHTELSVGRKDLVKVDILKQAGTRGLPVNIDPAAIGAEGRKTENYIFYTEYRGIEDIKLSAYSIYRNDRAGLEGRPLWMGARVTGRPSDSFRFWGDLALLRGTDELQRHFRAHALDVGATYVFTRLPFYPTITLGYAYGSGDGNPDDSRNAEFRQTGLQSNEGRFAGVSKFKFYGETLDLELSNLQILTAGFGFRPAANVYVDFVYHLYRLNQIADETRNWALTAFMNQEDALSKDVGSALDVVIGFRRLFGVQKLGLDLRMGWFFPGKAFLRDEGVVDPNIRRADNAFSLLARVLY
jgi:alginate production protein